MTHTMELPALDGRDALGFLTALGTLRLLNEHARIECRLSFSEETAVALLHGPLRHLDDVVAALVEVVTGIPERGVIPGVPVDLPLAKSGQESTDPMRVPRDQLRGLAERVGALGEQSEAALRWLAVLVTDLAVDAKGRIGLTPYTAPAGQQILRSFFDKPLAEVRKDPSRLLREALTRWRRVDDFTGEYLDHRAVRRAVELPTGKASMAGVPGATWLAIMALPMLRLTGTGARPQAALWHTVPGQRQPVMLWPIWRQPLDPYAVSVLLEHPALRPRFDTGEVTVDPSPWPPLGVFTVGSAARRQIPDAQSAGVITPITVKIAPARR